MRKIKYFTKDQLVEAAKAGQKRGYNRQLDDEALEQNLPAEDIYPVSFSMVHEHIAGEQVEPHIRAMVIIDDKGAPVILDLATETFDALAEAEVPEEGDPPPPISFEGDTLDAGHRTRR
jgi:hypothetical protein